MLTSVRDPLCRLPSWEGLECRPDTVDLVLRCVINLSQAQPEPLQVHPHRLPCSQRCSEGVDASTTGGGQLGVATHDFGSVVQDVQELQPGERAPRSAPARVEKEHTVEPGEAAVDYLERADVAQGTRERQRADEADEGCGVYLVDGIKGTILYHASMPSAQDSCDVHAVLTENWFLYTYYEQDVTSVNQAKGWRVVSVELYEGKQVNDKTKRYVQFP